MAKIGHVPIRQRPTESGGGRRKAAYALDIAGKRFVLVRKKGVGRKEVRDGGKRFAAREELVRGLKMTGRVLRH